ncbi:MAG TPA: hypothetical protein PLS31_04320 [Candidatus Sumerlaeota bacterium]|nr:hypothetical protein [Candidatus Sumerlaeota bacterium]
MSKIACLLLTLYLAVAIIAAEEVRELNWDQSGCFRLTETSGDIYEKDNTQKVVYVKKPQFTPPYYYEATVQEFFPTQRYTQAGLIFWRDADNYVRNTIGFITHCVEGLAEWNGKAQSRGISPFYPNPYPEKARLRIEVGERTVRTLASVEPERWILTGGWTLPQDQATSSFANGIGVIGLNGVDEKPLFCDWTEGLLGEYEDDDFGGDSLKKCWMVGMTNCGWGKYEIYQKKGNLYIAPYAGSDIFIGKENYPFVSMPAPKGEQWEIEVKMNFDPARAIGRWNKAGVVLAQSNKRFITIYALADDMREDIFIEGINTDFMGTVSVDAFAPKKKTDIYFRLRKKEANKFWVSASYDGRQWSQIGDYNCPMPEPQIRLFASGDVLNQYPKKFKFQAVFDYVKKIE